MDAQAGLRHVEAHMWQVPKDYEQANMFTICYNHRQETNLSTEREREWKRDKYTGKPKRCICKQKRNEQINKPFFINKIFDIK